MTLPVSGLCLTLLLAAACSVDVGKLQGPAGPDTAPAADRPVGAEVGATGDDVPAPSVDAPAGEDTTIDAAAPEARPDVADLPLAPADGGDSPVDGPRGEGGQPDLPGTVIDGEPGPVDSESPGTGGAGDASGTGGAGGTGGTTTQGGTGGIGEDGGAPGTGGIGGNGGAPGTGGGGGTGGTDPDLVLWYKFDESSGTTAQDSSSTGPSSRNATLGTAGIGGSATFVADARVGTHALSLTPSSSAYASGGGYATLPAPAGLAPEAITIAVWVKLTTATSTQNWERIFDFGSGTGSNAPFMYLVARASDSPNNPVRFGISDIGHSSTAEERIENTFALSPREWHHIAIVLPAGNPYTGTMYIDGAVAGTNKAMTAHLSDVGTTTMNWLGRSPYTSDPFFYGALDDFRMYKRALSAEEIAALLAVR